MDRHRNVHLLHGGKVRLQPLIPWLDTLVLDSDFAKNGKPATLEQLRAYGSPMAHPAPL
jgi:hypothetical protein